MAHPVNVKQCQVCGETVSSLERSGKRYPLVGHHWKGYDYPNDLWWICQSCNVRLKGKHDGSLPTPESAAEYLGYKPMTAVCPTCRRPFKGPDKFYAWQSGHCSAACYNYSVYDDEDVWREVTIKVRLPLRNYPVGSLWGSGWKLDVLPQSLYEVLERAAMREAGLERS